MTNDQEEYSEGGSRIFRHSDDAVKDFQAPQHDCVHLEQITAHVEKHIGKVGNVFHELLSDQVHIDILIVEPTAERPVYTLITSGMSDQPMTVPPGAEEFRLAELMICLPGNWPMQEVDFVNDDNYWPIRWLKQLARMPHQLSTWLGYGHTIPNGDPPQPFAANTKMETMLITYPYTATEEFARLEVAPGTKINFYSLIPLHPVESEFKLAQGIEVLEEILIDKAGINEVLMVDRPDLIATLMEEGTSDEFSGYLKNTQAKLGSAPRKVSRKMRLKKPMWMRTSGDQRFTEIYAQQDALLARGHVVWGHIVQANSLLFEKGRTDSPANVLYSYSEEGNAAPIEVARFAHELFETKGKHTGDPEVQHFADLLEDEHTVESLRIKVPTKITGNIPCHFGAIMVCRHHLPDKFLAEGIFPLLVLPSETPAAMILPCEFWDPEFIEAVWRA